MPTVSPCGLQVLVLTAQNGDYGGRGNGWVGKLRQRDCEAELSGTGIPAVSPCGLQVLVMLVQMGTTEVKAIGGQGGRGKNEAEISGTGMPTVSPCGLQVLVLTAHMRTTEVKTIGE